MGQGAGGQQQGGGDGGSNTGATNQGGAVGQNSPGSSAGASDWRGSLTGEFEPLRGEKALEVVKGKDFNEVGPTLAKMVVHTQRLVGDSVRIPKADAKPEEHQAFWEKIGVPKDVSGYNEVKPPDIPDKTWDVGMIDNLAKPGFHKLHFTPAQAQGALGLFADYIQKSEKQELDTFFAGQDQLMDKWGLAFDGNVKLAYRTAEKFLGPALMKIVKAKQLDAHPDFLQGMYNIGKNFAEDGIIDGDVPGALSVDELSAQITDTRAKIAKLEPGSKERTELETKLEGLYKARFPEQAAGRR